MARNKSIHSTQWIPQGASSNQKQCLRRHHNTSRMYQQLTGFIELRFYIPPDKNRSFRRRSSQPISWSSTGKLKQTQQSKHASVTKYTTT